MRLMRILFVALFVVAIACPLVGCGSGGQSDASADGTYLVDVRMEGGSGRAHIASPTSVTVSDEGVTAVVEWSSPNYDYMVVDGERYLPTNHDGNSTFEIPVPGFDQPFDVIADTTAMSQPHEISYTLTLDSSTMRRP